MTAAPVNVGVHFKGSIYAFFKPGKKPHCLSSEKFKPALITAGTGYKFKLILIKKCLFCSQILSWPFYFFPKLPGCLKGKIWIPEQLSSHQDQISFVFLKYRFSLFGIGYKSTAEVRIPVFLMASEKGTWNPERQEFWHYRHYLLRNSL